MVSGAALSSPGVTTACDVSSDPGLTTLLSLPGDCLPPAPFTGLRAASMGESSIFSSEGWSRLLLLLLLGDPGLLLW